MALRVGGGCQQVLLSCGLLASSGKWQKLPQSFPEKWDPGWGSHSTVTPTTWTPGLLGADLPPAQALAGPRSPTLEG